MTTKCKKQRIYIGLPTKVSIPFYTRPDFETSQGSEAMKRFRSLGYWIGLLGRTRVHHTGIILSRDGDTVVLSTSESSRAKFVDEECFHEKGFCNPTHVADLGTVNVSMSQLNQFIKVPYRGYRKDMIFYCLFSRFFFPSLFTKSCTLITCEMLRIIGYHIEDYVFPRDLHRELCKHYPIKEWDDYVKENNLRS
jgi:hypothetical protein